MCPNRKKMLWHFRRCLNIMWESVPTFGASEGQLRASALTYFTLFAIVPVFALLFGVAKGFGLDEWMRNELSSRLSEHGEILGWIYNFADTTLRETKGGLVAGIGALILCWSVVKMIGNIESAFNRVWKVKKSRTIFRKFTDYLSFLIIAPVLLLAASSATVLVSRVLREFTEKHEMLNFSRPLVEFGISCVPYVLVWTLFTFLYIFLPNTRVSFKAALFGGVIAGSVYQVLQAGYIFVQMALSRYNVIYGSFSALPLFLIWMYLNWLIVLFGVTLSYLYQNFDFDSKQAHDKDRSEAEKRLLALMTAAHIAADHLNGSPPPTVVELADRMNLSATMTNELLKNLLQRNIIVPVACSEYDNSAYLPAMPLNNMSLINTLIRYDQLDNSENLPDTAALTAPALKVLADLRLDMTASAANIPLTDLVKKAAAPQ